MKSSCPLDLQTERVVRNDVARPDAGRGGGTSTRTLVLFVLHEPLLAREKVSDEKEFNVGVAAGMGLHDVVADRFDPHALHLIDDL